MTGFWTDLPTDRVVRLVGAGSEAIAMALEPLPDDAPAIITYYPHVEPSTSRVVNAILGELETAAVALFPAWLPGAGGIGSPGGAGVTAVRAVALEVAARSLHFGPFLADLAESALRGGTRASRYYGSEVRAVGLTRVVAESYGRNHFSLLVHVPDGLPLASEHALLSACEWMAQHDVGVWLTGPLKADERIRSVQVSLSEYLSGLSDDEIPDALKGPIGPAFSFPAVAGRPHPGSPAEQSLEAALLTRRWANGRVWNQNYQSHPLVNPIRLDLWWRDEHFVVEIDGPEHRGKWKFAEDRRRDVMLQTEGFAVLRFTNAQVLEELDTVLHQIEEFIQTRRRPKLELSQHA